MTYPPLMSRVANPASAILLGLALLGCATGGPEREAPGNQDCAAECQARYSTCSLGCGQVGQVPEIFEAGRSQTCLQDCKLRLQDCHPPCD